MTSPPATRTDGAGTATASPVLEADRVVFRLADPERRHAAVAVHQELTRPHDGLAAAWSGGVWTASLPRPDHRHDGPLRMEYAFVVEHDDGGREFLIDPVNPLRAEGAFGAKSVIEFPGYQRPAWVDAPIPPGGTGSLSWVDLPLPRFDAALPCGLWQPPDVDAAQPLPLLIAHDGPEYDELAGLPRLLSWAVATGRIPPLRVALLGPVPGRRDPTYSAAARYADGLAFTALGWLARTAPQPPDTRPVLMGASLGAL
ncbi:MAG TPA: hypothetical protein VMM13_08290, partial [Euzebya sp.]|nr:hypothetical protein [Euzebya sp.]